ncbi:hypothetical protein Poly51_43380 [Rubripirellula tenax]|uniref:TIGR03000 domain-containing protein n=1 Tax=Rubripirellula tenax TaxID=2528015 RepID=A0A5C6ERL8_9BACT|nr:TIGR03000 domain-containing protein [Rubripirellula tenax]TWU51044.1 hypothetical protein Poly51_43380 [Rubripirellula tenax]
MKCSRMFAVATATIILLGTGSVVNAGGSWGGSSGGGYGSSGGGYASSGGSGSSGGSQMGLFARLKARHASSGSSGGASSGGSSQSYTAAYSGSSSGGSSGGISSGSSGGSSGGGNVGPIRRLMAKIRANRAARHSGSHGGSSGGVTHASYSPASSGGSSSGGSSGGYASYSNYSAPAVHSVSLGASSVYESPIVQSSYESYTPMGETIIDSGSYMGETIIDGGSYMGETIIDGGSIIESAPYEGQPIGTPVPDDSIRYESAKPAVEADSAILTVAVPGDAVVTVNGHPTTSDGNVRQFMSRGLKEGFVYTYVVDVTYQINGSEKKDSKSIKLRPGDSETVEFDIPKSDEKAENDFANVQDDVITVVKLNVPASAKVSLAGNPTNGAGAVRTFRTKQLKAGEQWTGYTVRVTAEMAGKSVSKERTVDVKAGSLTELTFDFNDDSLASR